MSIHKNKHGFHYIVTPNASFGIDPPDHPRFNDTDRYLDGHTKCRDGCERDSRRSKLYAAERTAFKKSSLGFDALCEMKDRGEDVPFESYSNGTGLRHGRHMPKMHNVCMMIEHVVSSAWFQRRYGTWGVALHDGRGSRRGGARRIFPPTPFPSRWMRLRFPVFARMTHYVLHELIHPPVPKPHAPHGRLFCNRYLEIVGWHMGGDAMMDLQKAYRAHNVKWYPHQTVVA